MILFRVRYPEAVSSGEIGCITSHLKVLSIGVKHPNSPYAVIMEDDCKLDLVKYWDFTWRDFYSKLPYDWDVIQLAVISTGDIHVGIHKERFVNDFSTACYIINGHHAEKTD